MKAIAIIALTAVACGLGAASGSDVIYVYIEPVISDKPLFGDMGVRTGCYIGHEKECGGVLYFKDEGFGRITGSLINDLVSDPNFELIFSLRLKKEDGRDMLVGSAYTMWLSPDDEILGGDRTIIREHVTLGEEIFLAQPVGTSEDGKPIFLQISSESRSPKKPEESMEHAITLISTHLQNGSHSTRSWYDHLDSVHLFRSGFSSDFKNGARERLRYDAEVRLSSDSGSLQYLPSLTSGQQQVIWLTLSRTYSIDTLSYSSESFSADLTYKSVYGRSLTIAPGKMLKLIFPPDMPSVRGFDVEDTLIIVPD